MFIVEKIYRDLGIISYIDKISITYQVIAYYDYLNIRYVHFLII